MVEIKYSNVLIRIKKEKRKRKKGRKLWNKNAGLELELRLSTFVAQRYFFHMVVALDDSTHDGNSSERYHRFFSIL